MFFKETHVFFSYLEKTVILDAVYCLHVIVTFACLLFVNVKCNQDFWECQFTVIDCKLYVLFHFQKNGILP